MCLNYIDSVKSCGQTNICWGLTHTGRILKLIKLSRIIPVPHNDSYSMSAIQHIQQLIENRQFNSALLKLKKMVAKNNRNPEAHRLLGVIYLQQHKWPLAEKHLQYAYRLQPNYGPILLNLASLFKAQKKNMQKPVNVIKNFWITGHPMPHFIII